VRLLLIVLGVIAVVTTALPLIKSDRWWIRIWDFPRLQICVLLVISLGGLIAWSLAYGWDLPESVLLSLGTASLAYQARMMFPYTPLAGVQVERSTSSATASNISLLFANVLMQNRNSAKLLEIIRRVDPDVILTVETDQWWRDQLAELEETHANTVLQSQENEYGMLLYSRLPLTNASVRFLIDEGVPSIHATARLRDGQTVELRCLHPRPPFPTEDETATDRDAEVLLVGREIKDRVPGPAIVFGDLNDVAWSRTNYLFQNISGLLDPRVGRGFYNTFHASYPFIRFPLDHFFHSNHFRLVDFRRLPAFGSDHFPVFIKLSLEPDAAVAQEELEASAEEVIEAEAKIRAAH
jgi:endonuclease/exonuclease/phosphatase (EEP) superfamily protein YafD